LNPTYNAMALRKQWSDEHIFEEGPTLGHCDRCGRRRSYPDHVTRDEDKAAVKRWRDRFAALHG